MKKITQTILAVTIMLPIMVFAAQATPSNQIQLTVVINGATTPSNYQVYLDVGGDRTVKQISSQNQLVSFPNVSPPSNEVRFGYIINGTIADCHFNDDVFLPSTQVNGRTFQMVLNKTGDYHTCNVTQLLQVPPSK